MMSMDTFNTILDWVRRDGNSIETISLLGGEFPLNPNAKEMLLEAYDRGLNTHIVTNGSSAFRELIKDPDVADVLRDPGRDNLVAVSLDSLSRSVNDEHRGKGAYNNAQDTLAELSHQERSIRFRINATVTQDVTVWAL
jgi:MoaA/NifB/PqqE/SkfB family radical SAM enzyme